MLQTFSNLSIQRKQMLIIMLISAAALLLACVAFVTYDTISFRREMVEKTATLAEVVGNNTTAALDFNDSAAASQTLSALRAQPNIVQARIRTINGKEFASYTREGVYPMTKLLFVRQDFHEFNADYLRLFCPIHQGTERVGTIEIVSDLRALYERLWRYTGIVAIVFCTSLLVAFSLSLRLGRVISRPVHHLAEVVQSVARDKNYSLRATKHSEDELGQLIDGFNEMIGRIQHRDVELQAARDTLEFRVAERTKELLHERELLSALLDNSPDHIYFKDSGCRFIKASTAQAKSLGADGVAELMGKCDADFFSAEHASIAFADEQNIMRTGQPLIGKVEREVLKDGSVTWALTTKMPLRNNAGEIIGTFGISKDITGIKQFEAELRESKQFLQSTLDALAAHIAILDEQGRVIAVNAVWRQFASNNNFMGDDSGIGTNYLQLCESASGTCAIEAKAVAVGIRAVLARECTEFQLEYPCHGPQEERWFVVRVTRFEGDGLVRAVVAHENVTKRKHAEASLHKAHKELVETSRQAGMAEVATGVLHNVGNVLNSVNVASTCIADNLRKSKASNLTKVVGLLRDHETNLGQFMTADAKGKQIPSYLAQLAEHLAGEQAGALKELAELQKHIDHIKDIVTMQQSFAKVSSLTESVNVADLVEDALRMNESALMRHDIKIIKEFDLLPPVMVDKHKVLQILVNLVTNAKQACDAGNRDEKRMTLRVMSAADHVHIAVADNGVGIPRENLNRVFNHGFTTKKNGHGFGLHSSALAAKEMGGALRVHSDGTGQGTVFTLELPLNPTKQDYA